MWKVFIRNLTVVEGFLLVQATCHSISSSLPQGSHEIAKRMHIIIFAWGHIDDSFLMGYSYAGCEENIVQTVNMFLKLGFVIHPTKSVLVPTQELEFLGFLLNSISMTIRLPPRKAATVQQACANLLTQDNPNI